jgi:hypothetical protein
VNFHTTRGRELAGVISINVPAFTRYIPFTPDRELQEEGAPITRFLPSLTFQHLIDRLNRRRALNSEKSGIGLQVLQVFRPCHRPSTRMIAMESNIYPAGPKGVLRPCSQVVEFYGVEIVALDGPWGTGF